MAQVAIQPGLFTNPPEPRLLAGQCESCEERHFPTAEFCPYCSSDAVSRTEVGATGTLYLHTVVNNAPPGYAGPVPYGFGLVDLPEGLRVVTRLVASDLGTFRTGMAMHLTVGPLFEDENGNEVLSWAYAASEEPSR
jgi:uncharacterized OB-fold protein